jgi:Cu/Ag efflux protein CusF
MRIWVVAAATIILWTGPALADHHGDESGGGGHGDHDAMMEDMADMDGVRGTGVINSIDAAARTVNLSHDPIPVAGMPAMTMDMAVADGVMLHDISPGTAVDFTLVKGPDGIFQVGSVSQRE